MIRSLCRECKQILFRNDRFSSVAKNYQTSLASFSSKSLIQCNAKATNFFQIVRKYSDMPNMDSRQQTRRKGLMILTYISGAIGAVLLTAVGGREYQRLKLKARGIEPMKNRLYGRKPHVYRYRGYNLPRYVVDNIDAVHTFETKEDDVWVVTFPKAGTTWIQEIVYLIQSGLDFEGAKEHMDDRFPFFEFPYPGLAAMAKKPSPRFIKSHLPLSLLPNNINERKPKIVYLARNPKDTVVSFYHFYHKFLNPTVNNMFSGTFEDYCQIFINDEGMYGPWWKHVKEAWERRHEDNILFVTYEELQADMRETIKKVASFLGKPVTQQEVEAIAAHCSFDAMKNNSAANYEWFKDMGIAAKDQTFMRSGKVGDWRNHLSVETSSRLDEIVDTKLKPVGLTFRD